jgi:formylglycine-generating enzyme required for sulfatase activity
MKECSQCRYCFPDEINHCPTDGSKLKMSIQGDTVLDGRYQLDRRLGHGGMGIVFQGRHIFLKTTFAIKVILPDLVGNDPMLVTRFRQEAMVAARMRHQNLVNVTDFGVVHGMPYLVMEMVVGRSLHEVLAKEGRMPPLQALEVMAAVCAGVGAAHKQGVVHRDLKPLNIMLMTGVPISQGVKILDFGLAKIKSGELLGSFVAAQTTGLMGSPSYMAPELWSDDEPDLRADVYSLGIILFQMLSGEVPFRGSTIPSIMKKHLTQPPPSFAEQGVIVPKEIEAVVKKALAKARDDRYASVEDLAVDLEEAVSAMSVEMDRTIAESGFDMRTMPFPEMTSEQTLAERQRLVEDEVEQLAREFQEAQMRADEARQRAEEAARRKAEEDAARKRAEEEAARKRQEEEEARVRAEAALRKRAEEEIARRQAEEETERRRLEEIERERAEEETARKRAAEEAARLAREFVEVQKRAEEARLRADEEARLRSQEEVARRRAEEEARKLAFEVEESKRRAEEARQRAVEEARSRAQAEAERLRLDQKEAEQRAEEESRKRKEEEKARLRAMSEADRLSKEVSEAQRRADEAGQRAEEESERRAAEEAARRKAEEEARRLALEVEEAQLRVEEARKRVEEARSQAEAESQKHREELAAATSLRQQSNPQIHQSSAPDMGATIASMPPTGEVRPMDTIANLHMLGESRDIHRSVAPNFAAGMENSQATMVHQSHPSLQGSLHTHSSLGTISDIHTGTRSKKMIAMVGALVVLVVLAGGLGIALVLWKSSTTTNPPDKPATPTNSNANTDAPPKPPVKAEMVMIEGGAFQMGRSDIDVNSTKPYELNQYPAHQVPVGGFFIDRTEVSNDEYAAFVNETKHAPPSYWTDGKPPAGQEQWPVTNVTIADAGAFAQWRSKRDHMSYRLPSEAEWEYAARNGSQANLYPWGNEWRDNCANVNTNSLKPVGSYSDCGSRGGALDLIGNVWEWTSTKAAPYPGADQLRYQFRQEGQIIRGGSYREDFKGAEAITATRRSVVPPTAKEADIGFRLVRSGS